jgi:Fe-S-cluster containining protein
MYISEEECKKCGLCCWLDPDHMTGNLEKIIENNGFCPYYNSEVSCTIYETRPQACVDYERGGELCLERRKLKDKISKP